GTPVTRKSRTLCPSSETAGSSVADITDFTGERAPAVKFLPKMATSVDILGVSLWDDPRLRTGVMQEPRFSRPLLGTSLQLRKVTAPDYVQLIEEECLRC
ncbi:unnamed protein product, partial [Mycena citricolor]